MCIMKRLISCVLCLLLVLPFVACKEEYQKFTDYTFDYFDTVISIIGYETNEADFKANSEKIKSKLGVYHKLYTIYSRYDDLVNIYTINEDKTSVTVDEKITEMLKFSKEMYNNTNGNVNVAFGSVLSIWHEYRNTGLDNPENAKLPSVDDLKIANKHTNIDDLIIEGNEITLNNPEMSLDVGAIAKGYATEKTAQWMEKEGINGYLLNVGGNIRTVGVRPDGKKWQVGLENPDGDQNNPYTEILEISEMSVVTSGSYHRFYTVDGKNYHHIIDKYTLMPATGYKMVSVITKSSAVGDALSTALFCMEIEEGKEVIKNFENTYVLWVKDNGEKVYSKGFKDFLFKEEK